MRKLALEAASSRRNATLRVLGVTIAALIILVGAFDVVSSNAVLGAGSGYEINPLLRWTQSNWGAWWFVPKMLFHATVAAMVMWFPNRVVLMLVSPVVFLTAFVVWNNFQLAI